MTRRRSSSNGAVFGQSRLAGRALAVVFRAPSVAADHRIFTTVEGIETEEQFEYMRAAGVELAQGYLFGKPVPISEFGRASGPMLTTLVA
jgi:EAL domain-containing protein (putative c-di-GMP-specific phosphodiesterase class I)